MTAVELAALLLVVTILAAAMGVWWGRSLERAETRMRGEHALGVLAGLARDRWAHPSTKITPYIPAARLLARATSLPDPYPFHLPLPPTTKGKP